MQKSYTLLHAGTPIRVYEQGTGETPVLLLHGAGLDSALLSWTEVMALLAQTGHYTVYAIDQMGYGDSGKPSDLRGASYYPRHIAAVEDVCTQLGLEKFALSGISFGGAVAIGYALRHPEQLCALIPVDAWGLVSRMPMHGLYAWYVKNTWLTTASYRLMARSRALARWSIAYSLIGEQSKITPALLDTLMHLCAAKHAGQAMVDYQVSSITREGVVPSYMGELSGLAAPTLFINGERDPLVPAAASKTAAEVVPQARLHIMAGCKHWPQKERPDEFVQVVDAFLQQTQERTQE